MRISDWSSDVCSSHLSISPKNVATSRRQARKRLLREVKIPAGIVSALGLTQIIGYGTLYYSFSILSPAIAEDLGLSLEWVFGVFSLSLFVGGMSAPFIGRHMDKVGAATVMTVGSAIAAATLEIGRASCRERGFQSV